VKEREGGIPQAPEWNAAFMRQGALGPKPARLVDARFVAGSYRAKRLACPAVARRRRKRVQLAAAFSRLPPRAHETPARAMRQPLANRAKRMECAQLAAAFESQGCPKAPAKRFAL